VTDAAPAVRRAGPEDIPRVVELAAEHAAYEHAAPPPPDLAPRLSALLFDTPAPRLRCLVAELPGGEVVGYATCSPEISTWQAREYLHMDCLFLRSDSRGSGLGALLMEAVTPRPAPSASTRSNGRPPPGTRARPASTTASAPARRRSSATA
jgi:GNAT superfamily N-acetyltransferase